MRAVAKTVKTLLVLLSVCLPMTAAAEQKPAQDKLAVTSAATAVEYDYWVSLPAIILPQFATKSWDDRTHTQHFELHIKRNLDDKNIVGLKLASWRLFQPMGILWWDGLLDSLDSKEEFYPGHVREDGIGLSYQRMLWEGLFVTVEVLPQLKTYLDEDGDTIQRGFKLYTSFHLGYHFSFGRFFVEPQVHSQFWLFDTNTPAAFKAKDNEWRDYFLFEPNIYAGVKF